MKNEKIPQIAFPSISSFDINPVDEKIENKFYRVVKDILVYKIHDTLLSIRLETSWIIASQTVSHSPRGS